MGKHKINQIFDQWIAGTWNNLSGSVLITISVELAMGIEPHSFTKLFDPLLRAVPSVWGYEKKALAMNHSRKTGYWVVWVHENKDIFLGRG